MKPNLPSSNRRRRLGVLIAALACGAALPHAIHAQQRDRFEYDPAPEKKKAPQSAPSSSSSGGGTRGGTAPAETGVRVTRNSSATLSVGDVIEAYRSQGRPEMALYLPASRPTVAQVVVERKFLGSPVYFLKGISRGTVRGAIVQRNWLDKSGFAPKTDADLARIQQAMKTSPFVVTVK